MEEEITKLVQTAVCTWDTQIRFVAVRPSQVFNTSAATGASESREFDEEVFLDVIDQETVSRFRTAVELALVCPEQCTDLGIEKPVALLVEGPWGIHPTSCCFKASRLCLNGLKQVLSYGTALLAP